VSSSLEKIEDGAARMSGMLTALLDSSRIVLGDLALAPIDCDLHDALREALDIVGPELADRVTVEIRPGVETSGRWDAERLEHVFANLLSNAGKYSPPETPIRLTIDGVDEILRVAIQDEGIGIAPPDLPRLFDRYTRGRDAMAAGIEGFGLGLYLCRGIVEAHGGRIWAESDGPGQGTTIRLELPRVVAPSPIP
jgi:signal transduction histidine kinase